MSMITVKYYEVSDGLDLVIDAFTIIDKFWIFPSLVRGTNHL